MAVRNENYLSSEITIHSEELPWFSIRSGFGITFHLEWLSIRNGFGITPKGPMGPFPPKGPWAPWPPVVPLALGPLWGWGWGVPGVPLGPFSWVPGSQYLA